jgi:hypothetical protein
MKIKRKKLSLADCYRRLARLYTAKHPDRCTIQDFDHYWRLHAIADILEGKY